MPSNEGNQFPETRWTLIERLKSGNAELARRALDELCAQYHYPLYCYIRRRGLSHHDAEDVLHDFLARLLRLESFEDADAQKGRLRAFLSTALQRYLATWGERRARRERVVLPGLDDFGVGAEERYARETFRDEDTPDRIFHRKWAQALLGRALDQLGAGYATEGKAELFQVLRPVVVLGGSLRGHDPAALASQLGMKEPALRKALSRLLGDFRESLKGEVRQTVQEPTEVEEEMAALREVFAW